MKTCLCIIILAFFCVLNTLALKITEVGLKDDPQWVEIYNDGLEEIDIKFWQITDLDGQDSLLGDNVLNPGQYAVICWGQELPDIAPGAIVIVINDIKLTMTDDQVVLLDQELFVDAVCWSNQDETVSSGEITDIQDLFVENQWPNAEDIDEFNTVCLDSNELDSEMSFARYLNIGRLDYADNNNKTDWYSSVAPTPGYASDKALAVELSAFTATSTNSEVVLKWTTQTEVNNLRFDIFKNEEKVGSVDGVGNSALPINYKFVDDNVKFGKTYFYQIEDIDFFGNKNKSQILEITVGRKLVANYVKPKFALMQNFPNPFNPETWIPFRLAKKSNVQIQIYNIFGELIYKFEFENLKTGYHAEKFDFSDLSSGIYFYTLKAGEFRATKKMAIVK